jgi:methylenetetrahydrofolate dehydrogenase (NADP+) / methenyltetrahydrofolate cyclohydrolase
MALLGLPLLNDACLQWQAAHVFDGVGLTIIQVGQHPASSLYVARKKKLCQQLNIMCTHHALPEHASHQEVATLIEAHNNCTQTHGILLQLPLPYDTAITHRLLAKIAPHKDVDGLHPYNQGCLLKGATGIVPCTPKGIVKLLQYYHIPLQGRMITVVGRSMLVGQPLALLLLQAGATVLLTNRHTPPATLKAMIQQSDGVVSATGCRHVIQASWFRQPSWLVDVGIHRTENGIVGDVYPDIPDTMHCYTPVPGGVGPMTLWALMDNLRGIYTHPHSK